MPRDNSAKTLKNLARSVNSISRTTGAETATLNQLAQGERVYLKLAECKMMSTSEPK